MMNPSPTEVTFNSTDRYPWIVEAARKNRHRQFVIDSEVVVLGVDRVADFNAAHSQCSRWSALT